MLCEVKFGKYINFSYYAFCLMYLYIRGPRSDYMGRAVIPALVLVYTPTNNWTSLLLILRRVGPKNGCLRDIKRDKQAP